jgi:hypothetical protein
MNQKIVAILIKASLLFNRIAQKKFTFDFYLTRIENMKHPCKAACTTELASSPEVNTDEYNMGACLTDRQVPSLETETTCIKQ